MVTTIVRNVDLKGFMLKDLPFKIAQLHKEVATEFQIKDGFKNNTSIFAHSGTRKPRKYESVGGIPDAAVLMPATIGFLAMHGENIAVEVATEFLNLFIRLAPKRTGAYYKSLTFALNNKIRAISSLQKIQKTNPLKSREVVAIYSSVEYASTLEAPNYNVDGIFFKITKMLIAKYGSKASIKFTYISGKKKVLGFKYMTPMVLISGAGVFPNSVTTQRGFQLKRRKRKAALENLNRERAKSGRKQLKRLPKGFNYG